MTKLEKLKHDVQAAIPAYCTTKAISANALALQLKISPAIISNMINGNWDNISEEKWRKVWNKVNPVNLSGLYETTDMKSAFTMFKRAVDKKMMVGLIADTGMGKTTVSEIVASRKNVYYSYIDSTVTPKVFLKHLLNELGAPFDGSLHEMLTKASGELNSLADPLLIIDESAKLTDKMMLLLHSLRDRTKQNCAMVLAGMPDFRNKLIKFSNKGTTGYAEFYRRIEIWHEFNGLTPTEVKHILASNGIVDAEVQREYRNYKKIGDLMNAIKLYKELEDVS